MPKKPSTRLKMKKNDKKITFSPSFFSEFRPNHSKLTEPNTKATTLPCSFFRLTMGIIRKEKQHNEEEWKVLIYLNSIQYTI